MTSHRSKKDLNFRVDVKTTSRIGRGVLKSSANQSPSKMDKFNGHKIITTAPIKTSLLQLFVEP